MPGIRNVECDYEERVKGNCQFVLSVVAVIECTRKVITFVIEYCGVCVGMHTDQMCHKQGAVCRWQNTAISDRMLKAVQGTAERHGRKYQLDIYFYFYSPHHKYTEREMFRLVHTRHLQVTFYTNHM